MRTLHLSEGQGFLDGLYVGGFTVDLTRDGTAVVRTRTVYDLSDEEEATTFEAVQRDEFYLEKLRGRYLMRMPRSPMGGVRARTER